MKFLVGVGVALVLCWALLWFGVQIAVAGVHLVLLTGVVLVIWGLVQGRRSGRRS